MIPSLGAINLVIEEQIAELPFRPYTMLTLLNKVDEFQTSVIWDVNVGGAQVSGRSAATVPTVQNTDNVIPATLPIGNYVADHTFAVAITQLTNLGNLPDNMAPRALRNLFQSHVSTAFEVIFPKLNKLIWSGTGAADTTNLQVFGMQSVVGTGAYAGIDPATYPAWLAYRNVNGGTPRALSKQLFAEAEVEMFKRGLVYDMIVTTAEIVELYTALFDASSGKPGDDTADIGFTGVEYKGRTIRKDADCPPGTIWFINSRDVRLHTFAQGVYGEAAPSGDYLLSQVTNSEKTQGINFLIAQLPRTNPQSISYNISVMPQLQVFNRKSIAYIGDISEDLDSISLTQNSSLELPTP